MAVIVQTLGSLAEYTPGWWPRMRAGLTLYNDYTADYATMYQTQPGVRTCVDFLARNIAQLGLHLFRRVSETDRVRVREHALAQLLEQPNPLTTRYRMIEALVGDLAIYFNAYLWKKRRPDGSVGALLRIPCDLVEVNGGIMPTGYLVYLGANRSEVPTADMVHFRGYNPLNGLVGLSPLETLRRVLAEEQAMGEYRAGFWKNAARMNGIIERPAEAPEWSQVARERFKDEFEALYAGEANSGRTAILEEGMTWRQISFSAQESEYLAGRKLSREECARAYHIPLPMVGILDHATYSNVREQHKQLYQDCLGPWLAMLEQEFELQLLPDFGERDGLYLEFNIAEKLQGSFDEQTQSLQSAVGRPWMTANEARARMNLPSMGGDADALVTPLNVLVGGQASPRDAAPPKAVAGAPKTVAAKAQAEEDDGAAVLPGGREAVVLAAPGAEAAGPGPTGEPAAKAAAAGAIDPTAIEERRRHTAQWKAQLAKYFRRQGQVMASRVPASGEIPEVEGIWRDSERWDKELAADIYPLNVLTARTWAERVGVALGAEIVAELLYDYLSAVSRTMAAGINMATRTRLAAALTEDDPRAGLKHVFEIAATTRAEEIAITGVTRAANFGSREGAKQGGLRSKTWVVNSGNPRDSHAALDGETVGIDDLFSNGLRYPGDPEGGADDNAGCQCSLAFGR